MSNTDGLTFAEVIWLELKRRAVYTRGPYIVVDTGRSDRRRFTVAREGFGIVGGAPALRDAEVLVDALVAVNAREGRVN